MGYLAWGRACLALGITLAAWLPGTGRAQGPRARWAAASLAQAWKATKLPDDALSLVVQEVNGPRLVAINAKRRAIRPPS